jgi:hypothetical protein
MYQVESFGEFADRNVPRNPLLDSQGYPGLPERRIERYSARTRIGAGVVDRDGLENRLRRKAYEGSNPSLSARKTRETSVTAGVFLFLMLAFTLG